MEDTEILSTHRKAKVDRLNLVFVILKLVLVAGKLDVYVFVYLLIVSAFTLLLLAVGSMFRIFVVSDVGIWGKPALKGALPYGMTSAPRWLRHPVMGGLSPLLEKPDIYNGLYLLGKKADSFIEQKKTCWQKVFH